MKAYKNILVIKMSSLGDVLHALPTLYALRQNCPDARIVWAVHEQFAPVLAGETLYRRVIYIDKKRLKSLSYWKELRRTLHAYHFDVSFDLQGLAKSAIVAWLSGAEERYGYWEMREGSFLVSKGLTVPTSTTTSSNAISIRSASSAAASMPSNSRFPILPVKDGPGAASGGGRPDRTYVAIVPGARWSVKEWPLSHWQAFLQRLTASGMAAVLLGSGDDVPKGKALKGP